MLGEDQAVKKLDSYELYGKPQLRAICEHFGWDWTQWDDGIWRNSESDEGVGPRPAADIFLDKVTSE